MWKRLVALMVIGGALCALCSHFVLSGDKVPSGGGKRIANFSLTDPRDQSRVSLADLKDKKAVVVVFVGTECPINNAFLPRLAELHKEYSSKGVQFLAVNSNSQDTRERVAAHAKKHAIPFPVLKDDGSTVADLFDAKRTPEAFLLDTQRRPAVAIVYRGRIDDQFGIGYQRPKPTRRDLAEAIDELLAGKAVSQASTPVAGCLISRAVNGRPSTKAEAAVTYAKQVSRVLQKNCQECHRPGQIGPMPLLSYDDAVAWSGTIQEVIEENRMPPWYADPRHGNGLPSFSNDRRLSAEDKEALLKWIAGGCAKGDDKDLPPPRRFVTGWRIEKPDVVVSMEEEFDVPAEMPRAGVPYKYFSVDPKFTEDKWVVQAEAKPGAPAVVHHIIVFVVAPGQKFEKQGPPGRVLCGMAPGDTALKLPPGTAKKIQAGSKLLFQMHYTPNGTAQKDRSFVGMVFAKAPPERQALTVPVLNHNFSIPPGDDNYKVESSFDFKEDGLVLGFMPHMHLRGKDFLYEAVQSDGKTEVLLSVPRYNFNWQNSYRLAKPYSVPKGGKIHCVAHFDNSAKNPNNPDPTAEVRWGDQTWEEMMIGWMEFAFDRKP